MGYEPSHISQRNEDLIGTYICPPPSLQEFATDGKFFNPIPAGVLENQYTLGGVNLTPPLNPMFDV